MEFSTDQLILINQYGLALLCIDFKKSSFFFSIAAIQCFGFYFYKSCFLPQYFLKKYFK